MARDLSPLPEEQIDVAVTELIRLGDGKDVEPVESPEQFAEARQEMIAQAYEEVWAELFSPNLHDPRKRAAIIGFMEAKAGRPLELAT